MIQYISSLGSVLSKSPLLRAKPFATSIFPMSMLPMNTLASMGFSASPSTSTLRWRSTKVACSRSRAFLSHVVRFMGTRSFIFSLMLWGVLIVGTLATSHIIGRKPGWASHSCKIPVSTWSRPPTRCCHSPQIEHTPWFDPCVQIEEDISNTLNVEKSTCQPCDETWPLSQFLWKKTLNRSSFTLEDVGEFAINMFQITKHVNPKY